MCGCGSNFNGNKAGRSLDLNSLKKEIESINNEFSSFVGSLPKEQPVIDVSKYGVSEEEHFAYNPKHGGYFNNFSDNRGFKHGNELGEYDY